MSDKIWISPAQIEEQSSNAAKLYSMWMGGGTPDSWTAGANNGNVADEMMACVDEAKEIRTAMGTLLQNTVAWCKTVKVNFETTDNA